MSLETRLSRHASLAPAVLRVGLGVIFLAHAYAKAAVFTFPGTEQFFEAVGFPGWMAYPVFLAELLGGAALIVGFKTRHVALGLSAVMLGALKTHLGNGWMFTQAGGGWEFPAFLLVALGSLVLSGAGAFALDTVRVAPRAGEPARA